MRIIAESDLVKLTVDVHVEIKKTPTSNPTSLKKVKNVFFDTFRGQGFDVDNIKIED